MVGGVILGSVAGVITHYLTVPIFIAYQRRREKKMAERIARASARAAQLKADRARGGPGQ